MIRFLLFLLAAVATSALCASIIVAAVPDTSVGAGLIFICAALIAIAAGWAGGGYLFRGPKGGRA